jgi:hypothetical protein
MNRSGSFRWFLRAALVIVLTTVVVLTGSPRLAPAPGGAPCGLPQSPRAWPGTESFPRAGSRRLVSSML